MRRARAGAATRGVTASRAHAHMPGEASEHPKKGVAFPWTAGFSGALMN